jgi:hypothetical protein
VVSWERTHHPSVVDVVINDESKKLRTVSLSEPARGERFGVKKKKERAGGDVLPKSGAFAR